MIDSISSGQPIQPGGHHPMGSQAPKPENANTAQYVHGNEYLNLIGDGGNPGLYDTITSHYMLNPTTVNGDALMASGGLLSQIINMMQDAGMDRVTVAFCQIGDLGSLSGRLPWAVSGDDAVGKILSDGFKVTYGGQTYKNLFQFLDSAFGHASPPISTSLAFGKAQASVQDMTFPGDPKTVADDLVSVVNALGVSSVDWDIESPASNALMANGATNVCNFFQAVHSELAKEGKTQYLTTNGYLPLSAGFTDESHAFEPGVLTSLFFNGTPQLQNPNQPAGPDNPYINCQITKMFDGINVMEYGASTDPVTLDASSFRFGIGPWLAYLGGRQNASMLHIGFYQQIDYTKNSNYEPDPSSPLPPIPAGLSSGQAAAFIYQQILSQLGLQPSQMGEPFFWTDSPTTVGGADWFSSDFASYIAKHT